MTPPKQILERNATLADAGLQPAALIYVGFSDGKGGLRNGASCILPSAIELAAKTASDGTSSGGKDGGQPFFSFGDCRLNRGETGQQQVSRPRRKIIGVEEEVYEETKMAQNLIHNIYTCICTKL